MLISVESQFTVEHWLALWFRNPYVAGSNPAEDVKGYELSGEIAHKNQRNFVYIFFHDSVGDYHKST